MIEPRLNPKHSVLLRSYQRQISLPSCQHLAAVFICVNPCIRLADITEDASTSLFLTFIPPPYPAICGRPPNRLVPCMWYCHACRRCWATGLICFAWSLVLRHLWGFIQPKFMTGLAFLKVRVPVFNASGWWTSLLQLC